MACDASFLKHYHTPVIHFGTLHFNNEETLYYSAGPISRYSQDVEDVKIRLQFSQGEIDAQKKHSEDTKAKYEHQKSQNQVRASERASVRAFFFLFVTSDQQTEFLL